MGTGLTLTPSGTVNDGNGGNNYTYTFVPVSTGVITPAPLVVRANSVSIVYGSALPALTYTISGFVGGDTASVVSGAPVLSTTAGPAANVGTYPITVAAGTFSATNYTFPAADLIAGTLTVILPLATVENVSIQKIKLSKRKSERGIVVHFSEALDAADGAGYQLVRSGHRPQEQEAEEQAGRVIESDLQRFDLHGDALHEEEAGA